MLDNFVRVREAYCLIFNILLRRLDSFFFSLWRKVCLFFLEYVLFFFLYDIYLGMGLFVFMGGI